MKEKLHRDNTGDDMGDIMIQLNCFNNIYL